MTGQNVTECTGGAQELPPPICTTATTRSAIRGSTPSQALDLAFLLAELLKKDR